MSFSIHRNDRARRWRVIVYDRGIAVSMFGSYARRSAATQAALRYIKQCGGV